MYIKLFENFEEPVYVFKNTLYREPTENELRAFEKYPNISVDDVVNNFMYISVGRGMFSNDHKDQMIAWINKLINMYPNVTIYKDALCKINDMKPRFK